MIPEFPEFKKLELSDKQEIESITSKFPPYSDFNFTSMWSWDVKNSFQISRLNGNLVVKFMDYVTSEPFLSFLGVNDVNKTIKDLLEFAHRKKISESLRLIPREIVLLTDEKKFKAVKDVDSFDYIFSTDFLAFYKEKKLYSNRKHVKQFISKYNYKVEWESFCGPDIREKIVSCIYKWKENKLHANKTFNETELDAIERFFRSTHKNDGCLTLSIYVDEVLEGFYVLEILKDGWAIAHFEKENISFKGISAFLKQQVGRFLLEKNVFNLNVEQDLGIPQLRESKRRYLPVNYLEKYTISAK